MTIKTWAALGAALAVVGYCGVASAQGIDQAVGGYSWADAAKEAPGTKDFHSADGHLTFAVVTHTAGNGFFDPVYVGATVAGNMIGATVLLLGSWDPLESTCRHASLSIL